MSTVANRTVEYTLSMKARGFQEAIRKAQGRVDAFNSRIEAIEATAKKASLKIAAVVAAAIVIDRVSEKWRDFEERIAYVNTIAEKTNVALANMGEGVRQVTKDYGQLSQSTSMALYDIYSNVGETGRNMNLLEKSAKAAVAGMVDLNVSASSVTGVMTAMGISAGRVNSILDIQFKTIERGKLQYRDLAQYSGQFLGSAKNAGQEYADVMGLYATLTKTLGRPAMAATATDAFFRRFSDPEFVKVMESRGIQVVDQSTKSFRNYVDVVTDLNGQFEKMTEYERAKLVKKLMPGEEAQRALKSLSANFKMFAEDSFQVAQNNAGAFERKFQEMANTSAFKVRQLKAEWQDMLITLGEDLTPKADGFFTAVKRGIQGIGGVIQMVIGLIKAAAGMVTSLVSPVLALIADYNATFGDKKDRAMWRDRKQQYLDYGPNMMKGGFDTFIEGGTSILESIFGTGVSDQQKKELREMYDYMDQRRAMREDLAARNANALDVMSGGESGISKEDWKKSQNKEKLVRAWSEFFGSMVDEFSNNADEALKKRTQARAAIIRKNKGDLAADRYLLEREYYDETLPGLKRSGADPTVMAGARAKFEVEMAALRNQYKDEQAKRADDRERRAIESRGDQFALRRYDVRQRAAGMMGEDPEDRVGIEKWLTAELKKIDDDYYNWVKQQQGYYAEYTRAQLQRMLDDASTTQEEKYRIHAEINRRILEDEIGAIEAISMGWQEVTDNFQNKTQLMVKFGQEAAEGLRSAFSDSFMAIFKGDLDSLGDIWDNFTNRLLNSWLQMQADMLAQQLMGGLGGSGGGGLLGGLFGGGGASMPENKGGGMGIGGFLAGILGGGGAGFFPSFAGGGLGYKPTLARVFDNPSGPEAVIPLNDRRAVAPIVEALGGGGGVTVNQNFNIPISALDAPGVEELLMTKGARVIAPMAESAANTAVKKYAAGVVAEDYQNGGVMRGYMR